MTSVEKRHSSRRSRGHRKHSNGGFSNASCGGSFLDETDREVSNLTDRAFRSLCIGDEAVYNDSDLSLSSPSIQTDRQLAFSQDGDIVERDREEKKRAEQENFSLRVQQYGQDWIFGGMSGANTHRDPQWEVYGEKTQGMVSATFQHSFVETSQQEKSLKDQELSMFSNGASELSSQQRRSHSRVSSLVKAFNSDGHRDGAGIHDTLREQNDGTSWDRSALISIQRELSEFSTSYQENFNSNRFPSASPFSPQITTFYSSQVGAMAQMSHNSASAYVQSGHIKHSMAAQVNSNFFMHSEFSPFRLWRNHNRFPFQQGELSGFMQCSEFPKWYQTPVYNELSYKDLRHQRNTLAPAAPSTRSTSTVLQKSSAVEKRCESELACHYPHRKWTQNLGTNKLPPQRPSTASPTTEMSRRVRDTISSVKALQQKVKMVSEQNITTNKTVYQQGVPYGGEHLDNPVNRTMTVEPNVFSSNTRSSFGTSQLLTPLAYAHQEAETSNFHHYEVSPQPVEHPPVRAESRGSTPDVRMSSYKSRATSLLFNLKDNRKRVKSTYSPTKFKGLDTLEKNKQEPHESVIDIPVFTDPDVQLLQLQEPRRTNVAVNQYHNPGLKAQICQTERTNTSQYLENTSVQTQGQMVHHAGFSSFIPENYNYQLANGQNPYENVASFTPYKQDYFGSMEQLQHPYSTVDTARLNTDNNQSREYLISKANTEQAFNETVGGVSSKVTRYEQLIENKQNYENASSLEKLRQISSQDTENVSLRTDISSSKQDMVPLVEQPRIEKQSSRNKDPGKVDWKECLVFGISSLQKADLVSANVSNQLELEQGQKVNEIKDGILAQKNDRYTEQDGKSQNNLYCTTEKPMFIKNMGQVNQFLPVLKEQEKQSQQQIEVKPQFEIHKNSSNPEVKPQFEIHKNSSNPENLSSLTMTRQRKAAEIKSEQVTAENTQDSITEETKTEPKTQGQPLKTDPAEFISTQKSGSDNIRTEEFKLEPTKLESLKEVKMEQIKKEERTGEQKQHFTEKEPEWDGEKKTKAAPTRGQQLTEPKHIPEKVKYEHMTEEQVKAEQAELEKLKEEHIKNKLAKTEEAGMGGIKQAEVKNPTRKIMNSEQVKEEQLLKEQAEGEQMEAEQVKKENINPEKVEVEHRKAEQSQQVKELQTKAKYMKIIEDEMIKIKTDLIKVEGAREVEKQKDLSHVGQITAEKPTISTCLTKDTNPAEGKTEQATLKEIKLDRCRAELSVTENLLERSDHLTAKLTATQHARREPDKVEQVKTELAKAKAELAKIKEKMRGKKEKVKTNPIIKEDGASKNSIPLSINMDKNKDGKKQDQSPKTQTHSGADDYDRLREKYGFTNATETNKMLTGSTISTDANTIDNTPLDEAKTKNNVKINSIACSFTAAKTENKKEVSNIKHKEVTETKSVHTESSEEFKLSDANSSPINSSNATNGDTFDKLKYDSDQKLEKYDSVNNTISQQRDSDLDKLHTHQRKPESNEHSVNLSKDLSINPPRALSQKERAQTKQEILTSKIKAHAEKEISAIKEKGFALRDGFIGKGSSKHLANAQSVSIWQRPSSLEVPKNHENTVSNNVLPKLQMEPLGIQTRPAKFAPPQSCAAITGKPAATTTQLENLEKPANQTANTTMSIAEGKNQKENGIKSLMQSKEQAPENNAEKKKANYTEISAKQEDELQQKVKDESFSEKKEDRTQDAVVETLNVKPVTTEEGKSKEAANIDSASLNVIDSNEMTVTDDSLQIMGIVVTVRERKPSESITQTDITKNAGSEKECTKILKETSLVKEMDVKKTPSVVKEDLTKVVQNNYPENVQQALSWETKKKHVTRNVTEKIINIQQDNVEPQGETQLEPTNEKCASFSVTVPAKDKMFTETQTGLYQQKTTADKPKDITIKTAEENLIKSSAEMKKNKESNLVVNSKVNNSKDDSSTKQLSVKEDMTTVESFHQSRNIDGQSEPLHKETKEKSFNKVSPNELLQPNEKQSKEDITNVNVHIDRIAIRVVPAETKNDNEEMVERRHSKAFLSDTKHQQNVSSSWEEKTSNNEPCSKGFTLTRSEQEKEESLEDKLAVQNVLTSVRKLSNSLKASSKQNTNVSSESCKAENKKTESNIQPVEGNYFQIQGVTETSSEAPSNITTAEDKLKERELPGLLPNFTAISIESCKEIKSEVFVFSLDQSDKKASSENIQDNNIKKKNLEREDILSSNQTDSSMERWSKTEKGEVGQLDPISKRKEEQLHLSTTERQSSRKSQPIKTTPAPEKTEVKQKPKGRTTTIPEISALADYARLKVIVAEDKDETPAQEFPPNKKEGFFPLIHTCHSRPPVFIDDPQNRSVNEKELPNKMEISTKVNKEPKSIVLPKMKKEHQRTGMFKLGDKEKQEKMVLDAKVNVGLFKNKDKYFSQNETNKSTTQLEQLGQERLDSSTCQTKNHQVMAPSFAASGADNSSEVLTYLHPTFGQMHHKTEHSTNPEKNASPEIQHDKETRAKAEDGRTGGIKQEKLTTQNKETKAKQQDQRQQSEEEGVSRHEKEQNKEDIRIKNMIEERRASLAEEERRAIRREEEKRAREREAVAIMIKERREKQRQAEIKVEDVRKTKKIEEKVQKEEIQTKQKVEAIMTETDKKIIKIEDERVAKLNEKGIEKRIKQQQEERNAHDKQQRRASEEQKKAVQMEQQRSLEQEEPRRNAAQEEHQERETEEHKRKAVQEAMQRKVLQGEQQPRRAAQEEQQRKNALEEIQKKTAIEEQRRRAAQEKRQTKALQEEQLRRFAEEQQRRAGQEKQQKRDALEEQQRRVAQEEQLRKLAEEQQRKAAQEEQQRRAAQEEQQRRAAQEEQQKRDALEEQQRRVAQEEQLRKLAEEQQRKAAQEEQQRRAAQEEQQKRDALEEQQRRAAQEEQLRKLAEEQQRKAAQEVQQRRAAQEEQQRRAAQEEQQKRDALEEQQRRVAQEEQLRKLAEEQQRKAAQEVQQRRAAQEEQQKRAAQEEQQKRDALEEQQRRVAQEEQLRKLAEEQQRKAAQEEQQRRAAQEEQQRRAAQEEQQRRAAQEEQQRRAAQEEQQRRAVQVEQQRRAVQVEQQRRAAQEEQQRRAAQKEKQRRALHEQQRRVEEEHWRKVVQEKQQRRSTLIEEQRQAKQTREKIVANIQEEMEGKLREEKRPACFSEDERIKLIHEQEKVQQQAKEQWEECHLERQWMKTPKSEEIRAAENENILKQREEKQAKHDTSTLLEKNTFVQEQMLAKKENDAQAENKEEDEKDKATGTQMEKQKRAAQKMDALQYYALTSTDTEKKLKERQLSSPPKPYKPNAAVSPAPPLPRSNTSSPAQGVKPLMFRVKDNTFRGSSFTKSVKPRFHKNFGEDFWMGSPSDKASDRAGDDQDTMRQNAGTPASPEKGLNKFAPISESANYLSESLSQDSSASISHQRSYCRRSMAMDDDESRSVISSMSEDVESFATSAADVADVQGLFDYERPESACSVSSDVSRSLGKPPTVPPKSEKALRRAQRLTSHRIKKELAKAAAGSPAGVEKEVFTVPSSTEVCSSNHYAVASPHFSAPVAFAHAPTLGSGLPSSHTEHQSSHHSFHASPHATGPISLPMSSPNAGSTLSLPSVSHRASGKASKPAVPKTVAHVSSSPTPHLTNPHSTPVTQYHVESSPYHQSYPLTQRKVLQDLGSGQYFLVDVPVQVKTKTFFDPETGKYVQLNVRRSQPQQTYPQAHFQPQMQIKPQQQPLSQASLAGEPFVFYQGFHRYPQSHQSAVINSAHPNRSSGPPILQQQPGESNISTEVLQGSEGHQYIPEKTNYMDTVNDINKIYNMVNNSQDSNELLSECNSNNQFSGSSVCENDNTTNSLYQPRDIIAMSELEDFMEVSDW